MTPLNVAVCGGGRTGHLNTVLFKTLPAVRVSLLTQRQDVIDRYSDGQPFTALLPDGRALVARPDRVSSDPAVVVHDADVVVITVPAHARPAVLSSIADRLPRDRPVYVGAIPGFCGFDLLAEKMLTDRPQAVIWGMKDVPHTAFGLRPGVSVRMGGAKSVLHVATHDRETPVARQRLRETVQRLFESPVELLRDYLEITLTPANPIMHSSAIYGLIGPYGQWHDRLIPRLVSWWTECSELGAYFMQRSDEENQRLCKAAEQQIGVDLASVKPLKQEIVEAYGAQITDTRTLLSVLRTNRAYHSIQAPLVAHGDGYVMDRQSRAFQEDVAFGLSTLVQVGNRLNVPLPHIEEIYTWCASYMGGVSRSARDYFPPNWPA
ncbi:NAD/NADP octopine/nopaline dehydrogenase family protein [Micromonospora sp. HUAS LYJ1]|uniref:NAD/NADP octopine/nopaline dehydrogenase family protein n=1 Tax=Micromonospora sp. HUAS LYJ1 TaxID=3061626 RepID=UPI00267416F0|nr:NAD/NADP octopine/nopaline dehydrogenase family protein [Micromonospora sp. HUAS LYJ1]WKU05554.1 NAD/NADP octopine/nopaline dehydrogenase family protein [Micromonospora sp. HUAS LYJ1]